MSTISSVMGLAASCMCSGSPDSGVVMVAGEVHEAPSQIEYDRPVLPVEPLFHTRRPSPLSAS